MTVSTIATWKLTKWQGDDLRRRGVDILTKYGEALFPQFREEIKAVQYSWPRETRRKNKQRVTTPRDIVDLGGFLRSQERQRLSPTELRFVWSTPYANLIFNGYTSKLGKVAPPRNWIKPALDKIPLDDFFRDEWAKLASRNV